jgi:hypothetical protein
MTCTCLELAISPALRDSVRQAQFEFLEAVACRGGQRALAEYCQILRYKHTWGLCPACDRRLRKEVMAWIYQYFQTA